MKIEWDTVTSFVSEGITLPSVDIVVTQGFNQINDGGAIKLQRTGQVGAPSQTFINTGSNRCTDANGDEWEISEGTVIEFNGIDDWFGNGFGSNGKTAYTLVGGTWVDKATSLEQRLVDPLGGLFKGTGVTNGERHVQLGDTVPAGTTAITALIDGRTVNLILLSAATGSITSIDSYSVTIGNSVISVCSAQELTQLRSIAIANNTTIDNVAFLLVGAVLTGQEYLRVISEEKTYFVAGGVTGTVSSLVVNDKFAKLTTESGDYLCVNSSILKDEFNVRNYGAHPEATAEENTKAFQAVAAAVNANGGGKIIIPFGVYEAFYENIDTSVGSAYYQTAGDLFALSGCNGVAIEMQGSSIKTQDGLHFGAFDDENGSALTTITTDSTQAANIGVVFNISSCTNISMLNINLDGNIQNQVIGGEFGDTGIQLSHIGIRIFDSSNLVLDIADVTSFGLDNVYIGSNTPDFKLVTSIRNLNSTLAGRQAMSWTGGYGLTVYDSNFTYTGMNGVVQSSPSAGVDIEDNGAGCSGGRFYNCVFAGNYGTDFLSINESDDVKLIDCVIAGNRRQLWIDSNASNPTFEITRTKIYGNIIYPGKTTKFVDCEHFDTQYLDYPAPDNRMLDDNGGLDNTKFIRSKFYAANLSISDAIYLQGSQGEFIDCEIKYTYDSVPPRTRVGVFSPSRVRGFTFTEAFTNSDDCDVVGEHAYIDVAGIPYNNVTDLKFIGSGLARDGRTGGTNFVSSSKRNAAVGDYRTYTGDNSTSISIPLGVGTKIITVTKTSGDTSLRYCRAVVLVCSIASGDNLYHNSVLLSSIKNGLGSGTISVAQSGISGSSDALVITSDDVSLLNEKWNVYEIDLTSLQSSELPETGFVDYTLPATGFPI